VAVIGCTFAKSDRRHAPRYARLALVPIGAEREDTEAQVKAGFRVRVEVYEPFELVSHTYDRVFVLGRVRAEDSSPDELVVQADKGSTLWGRVVRTIVATPRHVGHSFDDMPGAEVIVSARAETDGDDVHFLGAVVPLQETP
jgi:hypothetical protein